jgi:SAM-dependent methyltransferase
LVFTSRTEGRDSIEKLYRSYYHESELQFARKTWRKTPWIRRNIVLRRLYHSLFGNYRSEILSRSKGRVLDVGCGTGVLLEELRSLGRAPFGVEPDPKAALLCQEKGFSVVRGFFGEVDLEEEFFGTVVFFHSLEHLPSPRAALHKAFRILKPGGRVFIYCPNVESTMANVLGGTWGGWQLPFHLYHFSPETLETLVLSTGFRITRLKTVTPDFIFHNYLRSRLEPRPQGPGKTKALRVVRMFPFRLATAMIFRFMDLVFPGKGECLQVELEKPVGAGGR